VRAASCDQALTQTNVTLPAASVVHMPPKLVEQESPSGSAPSMQAHVGVEAHDDGTAEHAYESGGRPPSGNETPGGVSSQR
jgi:hypothetical protein